MVVSVGHVMIYYIKPTNILVKSVKADICLIGPLQSHLGGDEVAENSRGKRS